MQSDRRMLAAVWRLRIHGGIPHCAAVCGFPRAAYLRRYDRNHEGLDCTQVTGVDVMSYRSFRIGLLVCGVSALQLAGCSGSSKEAQGCMQLKDQKLEHT